MQPICYGKPSLISKSVFLYQCVRDCFRRGERKTRQESEAPRRRGRGTSLQKLPILPSIWNSKLCCSHIPASQSRSARCHHHHHNRMQQDPPEAKPRSPSAPPCSHSHSNNTTTPSTSHDCIAKHHHMHFKLQPQQHCALRYSALYRPSPPTALPFINPHESSAIDLPRSIRFMLPTVRESAARAPVSASPVNRCTGSTPKFDLHQGSHVPLLPMTLRRFNASANSPPSASASATSAPILRLGHYRTDQAWSHLQSETTNQNAPNHHFQLFNNLRVYGPVCLQCPIAIRE